MTQQICDKAADNYPHVLKFALDSSETQTMCDKAAIKFVPKCYKTQEMYDRVVVNDPFLVVNCPNIYIKLKEWLMKLLMIIWQH